MSNKRIIDLNQHIRSEALAPTTIISWSPTEGPQAATITFQCARFFQYRVNGAYFGAPQPGIGWTYDGQSFAPPAVVIPEPEPVATTPRMTHFAFQSRLTLDEDIALELVLPTSPVLRVAMRRFNAAMDVDVSLPETQQLLGLLATTPRADDPQKTIVPPDRIPTLLALKPITERGAINPLTGYVTP